MALAAQGMTARRFLDRRALLNAMTGIAATGGSTNGILHLLAIAHEAEVALSLDELAEVGARTPVIASLAPSGRYMAEDLHRAGGTASVIRELVRGGLVDGAAPTVSGSTLAEETRDAKPPDGEVVFPLAEPFKATGALHALRGNLAPDGSLVKASGAVRRSHRGPARVFDSEEACTERRPRRRRPPRATCSSSATKDRRAARACARCSASRRRWSARGSASRSRSSPTAASRARPAG